MQNQGASEKAAREKWMKYLPAAIGTAIVVVALVVALLLKNFFHIEKIEQKKQIQQITVVTPPPPPPPPPKEEIKEPEVKEEIPEETPPDAAPDNEAEAPAGEDLGVDAEGSAGSDGFGLQGKKGGRGLLGGSGYEQNVRQEINEAILQSERLKRMEYVAIVSLRLADNGEFETVDVEMVSGNNDAKAFIEDVLRRKKRMSKPRPLEAASFVKLRIKSIL